jgi:hypothetical protein
MSDEENIPAPRQGTAPVAKSFDTSGSAPKRSRLPVMPLAVLLPAAGEVSDLARLGEQLERRLADLQSAPSSVDISDSAAQHRRAAEESMLSQVVQWLTVGLDKE